MEKILFRAALVFSILGLVLLFFFSRGIEIKEKKIQDISEENIGEKVNVKGVVKKFVAKEEVCFIEIENSVIPIVFFKKIELNKGDFVEIKGTVKEYKGKLELVAEEIKKIS